MNNKLKENLERINDIQNQLHCLDRTMRSGFNESNRIHYSSHYSFSDNTKNIFLSTLKSYREMIKESILKLDSDKYEAKYSTSLSSCYESLEKMLDHSEEGRIFLGDPNLFYIEEFADKEYIYERLCKFLNIRMKEYRVEAKKRIRELETELNSLIGIRIEKVEIKTDHLKSLSKLLGMKEDADGAYFIENEKGVKIRLSYISESNDIFLEISDKYASISRLIVPEEYIYKGLYDFVDRSKKINSVNTIIMVSKLSAYNKFDSFFIHNHE